TEYAILHDQPRSLPAGMPRALAAIVERALEKDPAARPPDAGALLRDLRGAPGRRRFHLRLPRRLLWFIPPLLILALPVALDRLYLRRASHIDSLAVLPLENRSGDAQQD